MSVHNRLLLNRLAVTGHRRVQVLLAFEEGQFPRASALIAEAGGQTKRSETAIGYVRAEVPIDRLTALVADPAIEAYQISSLSKAAWYRDGPPRANAELFRRIAFAPVVPPESTTPRSELPRLSPQAAQQDGYTANDDIGVGDWLSEYPTYDGRGVTIAVLESGQPEFAHPTLRSAKALDGTDIPKIVGILNTIDPDDPDETRVDLETVIHATSSWCPVGNRIYNVPGPGTYRLGVFPLRAGSGLVQEFGVLRNEANGELRVDTDSDADFHEEAPVVDVNERFDVRMLRVIHPRQTDLAFVVGKGRRAHQVHIYTAQAGHTAMTVSVAAGSRTSDGLASGVAPGAQVLLVRNSSHGYALHTLLESYLETIERPDVDLLNDSAGITIVPDTEREFAGIFFRRLIAVYRKPIIHAAGNHQQFLNVVSALGDVFSVGGSISDATFSAFYGGASLGGPLVHPVAAAGPGLDGALKPDFIAPVHRISADIFIDPSTTPLPRSAPQSLLPNGYQISCCTSSSSPYAAGVVALLVSAAKQRQLSYSMESLGRALRVGARFLPNAQAHQQGNGLLNLQEAWRELQRSVEVPGIVVRAPNVHVLTDYTESGGTGVGLFEREGWHAPSTSRRTLEFTRESGTRGTVTYRLSWTGNDGAFSTASAIALPLDERVSLPVAISVSTPGVHSAILNLHDPKTDAIVFRTAATIVAAARFDSNTGETRFAGSLPLMRTDAHFMAIPDDVAAISMELEVVRGSVVATVLPSHGLYRSYYEHVFPVSGRVFTTGRYRLLLPQPAAGTWSIAMSNDAAWRSGSATPTTSEAVYSITARILRASVTPTRVADGPVRVDVINEAAALQEPLLETSIGTLRPHPTELLSNGLPNQIEIDVPAGAANLSLYLRGVSPDGPLLELHLYDCTSGECFSHDFTIPAAKEHTMVVRRPTPGRWVAAVNGAPVPTTPGRFVLEEVITGPAQRHMPAHRGVRDPGAKWSETLALNTAQSRESGESRIILYELIDAAAERDGVTHVWENRPGVPNLAEWSIAIGRAVVRFD